MTSRYYGPLLEDVIAVLLRVDPERRPTADQLLSIPGIHDHVLAYTDRCKTLCSPPVTASERISSTSQCREENSGKTRCGSSKRVNQILEDSAVMTRRHSVASVGNDRWDNTKESSKSDNKHRRHSCGVHHVTDCDVTQERMGGKYICRKSYIASAREEKEQRVGPSSKISSQRRISVNERLQSPRSTTTESIRCVTAKSRSYSLDIVDKSKSKSKSKRAAISAGVPTFAPTTSSCSVESARNERAHRKTVSHKKMSLSHKCRPIPGAGSWDANIFSVKLGNQVAPFCTNTKSTVTDQSGGVTWIPFAFRLYI